MKNFSKNKGSSFERAISKSLSLWFSKGKDDHLFWRTINSGAYCTNNNKNIQESSDIKSISSESEIFTTFFNIECKHYKNINIWEIITKTNSSILKWYSKLESESRKINKIPFLIVKENNKPTLIISNDNIIFKEIGMDFELCFKYGDDYLYLYLFDEFLKMDSDNVKKVLKK